MSSFDLLFFIPGFVSRDVIDDDAGILISFVTLLIPIFSSNLPSARSRSVITRNFSSNAFKFSNNVRSASSYREFHAVDMFSVYILSILVRNLILCGAYPTVVTKKYLLRSI